jgi:uncharacterized membrane protein (UPF0127 family)
MKWRLFISLAAAGLVAGACRKAAPPAAPIPAAAPAPAAVAPSSAGGLPPAYVRQLPTQALPKLRTAKLWLGSEEMTAELAVTPEHLFVGMMFRTNLEANAGMLFLLGRLSQPTCWTYNCPLALSAAYLDPAGIILELHDFQPMSTNLVAATATNVQYILETSRGWFEQHHIGIGTLVRTEQGSLPETFTPRRNAVR